jgi:two-component system response regulator AlgR
MKILVVDDEPLARERMLRLLARVAPDAEVFEAGSGEQALELAEARQPDLLLLDIRMPGIDGMEVATRLQSQAQVPAIVFCTAYDEYALAALDKQAAAYLLKPVREEKLRDAIGRAGRVNRMQIAGLQEADAGRNHIVSETHKGVEMVGVDEVRCFIAEQKYVRAEHPQGSLLIPETLKELEQEFGGQFIRVHRNALVALAHIAGLRRDSEEGWCVELAGVDVSPGVSRRHLGVLKEQLKQQ